MIDQLQDEDDTERQMLCEEVVEDVVFQPGPFSAVNKTPQAR
jgi:hypothetical protein